MKNNKMFSRISIALVLVLVLSSIQMSFAAGTSAGTAIANTASVTFNDGSNVRSTSSNTVSFYVGHKVSGAFTPLSGSTTTYDNVTYYYAVSFQNQSNRGTPYSVSFNAVPNYSLSLIADANGNGTFDVGELPIVSDSIGVDATKNYLIKAVVGTVADLTVNNIVLTLTNAGVDDVAGNVVVLNPAFSKTFTLTSTINKAVVSFAVSGSAPSPLIPGALFNYNIAFDNTGSATPFSYNNTSGLLQFTYTIPTNFTFGGGGSGTLAISGGLGGTIAYSVSGSVITFSLDTAQLAPALASASFTLPITINQTLANGTGPAPGQSVGTSSTDFSSISYGSGQNPLTEIVSTSGTIFNAGAVVAASKGGKFYSTPANATAAQGENIEYVYTLKNMGNTAAIFTLADVQYLGQHNVDHLIALTSTGTDLTTNPTGSINPGDTIHIYVRLTVPTAAADDTIARQITVTSTAAGTLYTGNVFSDYNHVVKTRVVAATFSITLAIEANETNPGNTTNPAPSDVIRFALTIANTSPTVNSTNVVISNLIPTNMSFVTDGFAVGSGISIDGTNKTNANDGDDAWFDVTGNGTVQTNSTFSVNALASKVLRYKCSIN